MPAPLLTQLVYQGATLDVLITLNTPDTPPVPQDLTGCSARMIISANYSAATPLITLTSASNGGLILGGTAGTIEIILTPAQTQLLAVAPKLGYNISNGPPSQTYVGELDVTYPSGSVARVANYLFTVTK